MCRKVLFVLVLVSFFFIQALRSEDKAIMNNSKNSDLAVNPAGSTLILYGAVLETATPTSTQQQDEGILSPESRARIRIINLGPMINTNVVDYAPTVSADGKTLYFVSNRPGSKSYNEKVFSHDFWAAKKNDRMDTVFLPLYNIDTTTNLGNLGVNTVLNEGAASIAADRQSLYFTGCERPDGLGSCDIYKTTIEGDRWGRPVNLGKNVNSKYWDSQPSIAPDQSRIYFTSTRPGPNSNGDAKPENMDIWYADWDAETEEWKPAQNLSVINTPAADVAPFIAADNVTLFFSSKGHTPNLGGLDFYLTRNEGDDKNMKWTKPQNLLEPINTGEDDQFITLPASGDILYFSSRRTDLPHYQGDLDVFMAFVPSFFRAVNVKVKVVDECSGQNIPATVTISNPVTNRVFSDSLTMNRTEIEMIVSNTDYGNPKDSLKFVDLQVSAVNAKYGVTQKVQRVMKPAKTKKLEETQEFADFIEITLTLGQRPVIGKDIDEASYIKNNKASQPALAGYNGLVMEEFMTWDLYPLLNYVFFDLGKSDIPSRYNIFSSNSATKDFTDSTINGGTLDRYYHVLNIYGYRLNQFPDAKIEVVGCNDGTTAEEKRAGLSKERATNVYNYLKDVWNISESRMKLVVRDKPERISNLKDSLGITENRRVEILCPEWNVMKPVFDKDPKTFPQPDEMKFTMKNGIEDDLIAKRRIEVKHGAGGWKTLANVGITDQDIVWNWQNESEFYPKDEESFVAKLVLTTKSGKECESDPITIPVKQVTTRKKRIVTDKDSTKENYSLILFPFDSPLAGPLNERIMRDYVYDRCMPNSSIEVVGHTDVVGLYDHNQKLSDKRSNTVYDGIMKQTKSKVGKISKRGVGEDEPLYNNTLPEGRFYNRTVFVKINTPIEKK
jgi:outer membrane protein OmpA-like peptidoglycan-associated protein